MLGHAIQIVEMRRDVLRLVDGTARLITKNVEEQRKTTLSDTDKKYILYHCQEALLIPMLASFCVEVGGEEKESFNTLNALHQNLKRALHMRWEIAAQYKRRK